ncbi:N-acetylmuramoyl-L-alanine amidase [Kineococcus aurantiacus]|uniref:Uncharacterized protein with LGFP repeats n=1 Tax=Kineococcus aurantiacus TaxID=37633 RepID=A0A7Y9DMQ1_9ACTN|nr:N-acetylmuramoyl-L-alanine amidase [Kineococcus aurantiacus]NYD23430.1 uncharacterized protein with LGFP repeats [Kineococcus aurantiacus]
MRSVSTPLSRRALLTGVLGTGLAGAAGLAAGHPARALAPSALTTGALQVAGSTQVFALGAGSRTAGLLSSGALTTVRVDVSGGHLVGVTFPAGTSADSVQVRTRRAGGDWSAWHDLTLHDSEPDPGTAEARTSVAGSDPLWVGALGTSATVEVRLPAADAATAQLQVVDAGASSALRTTLSAADAQADEQDAALLAGAAQPVIRSRADWGADESLRKGVPGYGDTIKAVVVHHTADGGSYSQADVPAVMRSMYRYHTVSLGWSDLGYNFVVDRFGGIWEGRAGGITRPVIGAHAGGFNTDTFGVSMIGDFTSVAPTEATLNSVAAVIAWKFSMYGLPAGGSAQLTSAGGGTARYAAGTTVTLRTINAHRDVGFTACPGNVGFTKMGTIRDRVAALLKGTTTSGATLSDVAAKYTALGGAAALGAATSVEGAAARGGRYRHYQVGSIYYLPATGAHLVRGLIRDKWKSLNWENSFLGFPTTDEVALRGGAFNHFQGGSIYYSPRTGAHAVRGAIRDKWASLGWETGYLGYPKSDEWALPRGAWTEFQGGSVYWSAATGAHAVRGLIRDKWGTLGWENGVLGYPTTDEVALPGGAFTHFQGGSIYFSPRTGTHVVRGLIRDAWAARGWETGELGYPTSDEYDVSGGRRSDFQGGSITWNARTGKITVVLT